MTEPIITEVRIRQADGHDLMEVGQFEGSMVADLTFADGSTGAIAWYYDEITFNENEILGKTYAQLLDLKRDKDIAWLRTP